MGHCRLLSSAFVVLFACFLVERKLDAAQCWQRPWCSCGGGERKTIYCRYVRDIADVVELFKNQTPVYRIRLHGSFATIPSRAFDGISVSVIALTAPLEPDIPRDALLGVVDLRTVVLNRTVYQEIPDALANDPNCGVFESVYGELSRLDAQLQNMSSVTEIALRKNRIASVSPDAFRGSAKLQKLDMSYNEITHLHPETFDSAIYLDDVNLSHNRLLDMDGCFHALNPRRIDLFDNNLTSIDRVIHQGMFKLHYLNLGGNPDIRLTSASFHSNMRSLSELHLSENHFGPSLDPSLLRNLWNLHDLYLNDNNLTSLSKYFLQHTPFLTTLELSNNRLQTVEGLLGRRRDWYNGMKVTLDGNDLTTVALSKQRVFIYSMDMSRNRIGGIKAEDMVALQRTVFLNLSRNEIDFLESGCFKGFHSLQQLDLSYNHLTNLNGTLRELTKLYRLQIRSSQLETLSEDEFVRSQRLKSIDLRDNHLSSLHGVFRHLRYINEVDVSANNLTTLTTDSFPPFQKISIRVRLLRMADNPWACDCRLAWFANWVRRRGSRLLDEPVCASPVHLRGLTMRTLNLTDFETWLEDCPASCDCICKADGDRMFTEVRCHGRGLKEVPGVLPPNVRSVDLRGNLIEAFDGRDLLHLQQLEKLELEHNKIQEVRLVLPAELSSLGLASNCLRVFPLDEWTAVNASVSLSRNPWRCDCGTRTFRNWLLRHNESVVDLSDVRCGPEESPALRNRPIVSLTREDLCSNKLTVVLISACSVLLLILAASCFWCRRSLAACLYFRGCTCLKRSPTRDYPYDAFLLYSEADEDLALGEVAKGLEAGRYPFFLCIPNRDIASPRTAQKVNAYLPQCHKVIVLLTRKFIENQECLHLLISAMSFSTESSSQCIIIITHGDLPPASGLDPVLRTLLRSCTCLKWGQCLFWQKLIYQLPKKRIKNHSYSDIDEPLIR